MTLQWKNDWMDVQHSAELKLAQWSDYCESKI